MGTIRVEFVPIKKYGLGLLGFDHLQLVYEDETSFVNKQDDWYVLEGTQEGSLLGGQLGVLGEDIYTPLSAANGGLSGYDLVLSIGTPEVRGSRVLYQGADALSLWNGMMSVGQEIAANALPYEAFSLPGSAGATINSSSVVATLLNSIGYDINVTMPYGIRFSPGTSTLIGTTQDDTITLAGNFTQAVGGSGQDSFHGTETLLVPEKFFGGEDNDTIHWSKGDNIVHGGQPRLAYAMDGVDTIDYAGVGHVRIVATQHAVEHKVANFVTDFAGGSDQLFSIEAVNWYRESDVIDVGQGVDLLEAPVRLKLDDAAGGRGDELGFQATSAPLIVNVVDDTMISVQTQANSGEDAGYWAESVEWLAGSAGDDRIYAGATLHGVEGGEGNDLLDARLVAAFAGGSLNGYDVDVAGGEGNDTIVSGAGISYAAGGNGADRFVLSTMTTAGGPRTEFIVADASSEDKLFLPYDFFQAQRGAFDGSTLMQLRGSPFKITDTNPVTFFAWGPASDDQEHGYIDFVGMIQFYMDGADLIISLMQGHVDEYTVDLGTTSQLIREVVGETETETFIRVLDWQEGDLGLTFPITYNIADLANNPNNEFYPGFNAAVASLVGPDIFAAPLDTRPDAYLPQDIASLATPPVTARVASFSAALVALPAEATQGDDVIVAPAGGPYRLEGLAGNDDITGSDGSDAIDGGSGADTLAGGRGNDAYFVDDIADIVIENARSGFDHVYSSVDYTLGDNVEHLTLTGSAIHGTGNALRNTLSGNDADNLLVTSEGDDTLAGNKGNDTLFGGEGGDGYVYELGDGNDFIFETGSTGHDVIVLAGQMSATDFVFTRDPLALDNLVLRFWDGGSLTIADYFALPNTIDGIEFVGGTVWDTATLQRFAATALVTSNRAPIAHDDAYVFGGDTTFRLPVAALLDNDRDLDGDPLTITAIVSASQGNAVLDGTDIVVSADSGTNPRATFTYQVSDGAGGTATATADIAFAPNHAPVITTSVLAPVTIGQTSAGTITATDADGDQLFYALKPAEGPAQGTVVFGQNGALTYTPGTGASGTDHFTVVVSDVFGASAEHTFDFTIAPQVVTNRAPIIVSALLPAVSEDTARSGQIVASDPDGDDLTFALKAGDGPSKGQVVFGTAGAFTYTPNSNANGAEHFTAIVDDGHGGTVEQAFNFTIAAVNDAPVALDDTGLRVEKNHKLEIKPARLLANDSDIDGDRLTITSVSSIKGGQVSLDCQGAVVFKAARGFTGTAQFTYTVKDGHGGSDSALVSVFVEPHKPHHENACRGGAGNDWLSGTSANDILTGNAGADTFRFGENCGHDTITDLRAPRMGADILDLRHWDVDDFAQLARMARVDHGDLVIARDAHNSVTLENVHALSDVAGAIWL